ncbi:MAG: HAD-IIIA family hydrolase, partial [Pseudomonadota bacterium]
SLLHKSGFICVVITNQSVVGRGIISQEQLDIIHKFLCDEVVRFGGKISEIFACTDHPKQATNRRKPASGMLIEALEKYSAKPERTPFIGDAITDMEAAFSAGCERHLVLTGKGKKTAETLPELMKPVHVHDNLLEVAKFLITR